MTINEMLEQGIRIQGQYTIKMWSDAGETYTTLAEGHDFECESHKIISGYLDAEITYIYAVGGILIIEIKLAD